MSYLRKLQKDKHNRINAIKYAPLVHDAKSAHVLALNNIRESKKLIEKTYAIEQEMERWKSEAEKAEKIVWQTTRQIISSSGRLKRKDDDEELPNIVLTGADTGRSRLNASKMQVDLRQMKLIPRTAENDPNRRRLYANVVFPSVAKKLDETVKQEGGDAKKANVKSYEKLMDPTAYHGNMLRRRSDCCDAISRRNSLELFKARRASDGQIYPLQRVARYDRNLAKSNIRPLFLSLPATKFSHRATWNPIDKMDSVPEDGEEETEGLKVMEIDTKFRSGTM